jgi:hypothetical protein
LAVVFLGLRWAAVAEAQDKDRRIEELRQVEAEARARAEAARQQAEKIQAELKSAKAEQEAKAAPLPARHFLEKGKSYFFSWQNSIGPAVVLEEPRDHWVKVRTGGYDQWINLNTVYRVMTTPEAKDKKDPEKGAVEAKGTVQGVVVFLGKPVTKGKVVFHPEKGSPVEAVIKDGQYTAKDVPAGTLTVTVAAEGLPEIYASKEQTPLMFQVRKGVNQIDLALMR